MITSPRRSWQKSMSKSGIDTRSGLRKRSNSRLKRNGIEVGDGEHIGDERAGTRAAAGAHGNAVRLRPLDEVGHDQEVAGELHLGDDVELEVEALDVVLPRAALDEAARGEPLLEARMGLDAQFLRLVAVREARQDRCARLDAVGAAHGDLDRVLDRLGNVGEERRHLLLGLEVMLGREAAAVLGDQHLALGDADQRVMRGVVIGLGEVGLVGGDQRDFEAVGKLNQAALRLALGAVPWRWSSM